MTPQCTECSEKATLSRIEKGVNFIRTILFESTNGDSLATQISKNTEARKQNNSRVWDVVRLLIAACTPIAILWATGKL